MKKKFNPRIKARIRKNKQVLNKETEFENTFYENANEFEQGILATRYVTGSDDNYFETSGEYTTCLLYTSPSPRD